MMTATPSATHIQACVAKAFGMTVDDVVGRGRSREFIRARHTAIKLCREKTRYSAVRIGRQFGLDHTTVLNALKSFDQRMEQDDELAAGYHEALTMLGSSLFENDQNLAEIMHAAVLKAIAEQKLSKHGILSGPATPIREGLEELYGEVRQCLLKDGHGQTTELLTSPKGTWTVLEHIPGNGWVRFVNWGRESHVEPPRRPLLSKPLTVEPVTETATETKLDQDTRPRNQFRSCKHCGDSFSPKTVRHKVCPNCKAHRYPGDDLPMDRCAP